MAQKINLKKSNLSAFREWLEKYGHGHIFNGGEKEFEQLRERVLKDSVALSDLISAEALTAPAKPPEPPKVVEYKKISNISELLAEAGPAQIIVERVVFRQGEPTGITLSGRRLMPAEQMEVKILLESALPPELPPEKPGETPRYDLRNPGYLREKEVNQRKARAYALIKAFPVFGEGFAASEFGKSDKPSMEDMWRYMEQLPVEDDLLETAFAELTRSVIGVDWQRVSFSSGSNSLKS